MYLIWIKKILAKVTGITGWEAVATFCSKAFYSCKIKMYNFLPSVKGTRIISVSKTYIQGIFDI